VAVDVAQLGRIMKGDGLVAYWSKINSNIRIFVALRNNARIITQAWIQLWNRRLFLTSSKGINPRDQLEMSYYVRYAALNSYTEYAAKGSLVEGPDSFQNLTENQKHKLFENIHTFCFQKCSFNPRV